jgi:hypothetical protein
MFWLGAMTYQSNACRAPMPEAMIGAFAKAAGVTKADVLKEGPGSPFAEGYQAATNSARERGLSPICNVYRAHLEEMREKGLF